VSLVKVAEECPSISWTILMSMPAARAWVAVPWRMSCSRIGGSPAAVNASVMSPGSSTPSSATRLPGDVELQAGLVRRMAAGQSSLDDLREAMTALAVDLVLEMAGIHRPLDALLMMRATRSAAGWRRRSKVIATGVMGLARGGELLRSRTDWLGELAGLALPRLTSTNPAA
jgi:hypothetical protein